MRSLVAPSICILAMLGCASPPPAPTAAAAGTASPQKETDDARAQRLINYSVESGAPINTADGKKLICKQESVTNTRLKNRKVCLTEAEWMARTDNAKEGLKDAVRAGEYLPPEGK